MKYLLDVNVLLSGIWTMHPSHAKTFHWLEGKSLVLCPLAGPGFLRISGNERAFNFPMAKARQGLAVFCADRKVEWIADDLLPLEFHPNASEVVTDSYLTDLADRHALKLATLDEGIKHPSVELVSKRATSHPSS